MASNGAKQLGITAPLSTEQPTEDEKKTSNALLEELKRENNFETAAEISKRATVLRSLQSITEEFVKKVCRSLDWPEVSVNSAGGKIFTYGSYRLGVTGPGSDIDTLVVVPKDVTREHWFEMFPDLLVKMAPKDAITELQIVKEAFVPLIKFVYSGIDIDLIFSRLEQVRVPRDQELLDDSVLQGLDEVELRSLNGTRVTDEILELVPQKAVFKLALRAIKLWAQRRAIYANKLGFPGGVAWAMLVARVCQLYPQAVASKIVHKFFHIIGKWQWPTPVLLKTIKSHHPGMKARVWNPRIYKGDSFHIMPIITPAFPSMCSTHNITRSTKEIIQRELERGTNIMEKIMTGKAAWKDLFMKHTFFTQGYKYYLSIISASTDLDTQLNWSGTVESKVRLLVQNLEGHESVAIAHPFIKGFERIHNCKTEEEVEQAKSGSLEYQVKNTDSATPADGSLKNAIADSHTVNADQKANGDAKPTMVYTTTFYVGLELHKGATSLDLAWQVDDFREKCIKWEKYNAELSALSVIQTRNYDLPSDVFTDGEVKPVRAQKKRAANGQSNKRAAMEDPNPTSVKRQQTAAA